MPVLYAAAAVCLLFAGSAAAVDTLVLCPTEFQAALVPWEKHRRQQGHEILFIPPPEESAQVLAAVRRVGQSGRLKYLLLVGDVPGGQFRNAGVPRCSIPTNYVSAKVNTRWGSEPTLATDAPYGDLNGDGVPELAVGRIPADSVEELAAVVRKILRYEQQSPASQPRHLNVVAGMGGFGTLTDALIEAAARQVIQQTVPLGYDVRQTSANPTSPHWPPAGEFRDCVCRQFAEGGLAWIYLGHGLPSELDRVATPKGHKSILSVDDVPLLRCGSHGPLAVLVACYTGAIDAGQDCLAEELLLAEEGPVAVIAATRVTMPYGNTVLGYELLRAYFSDRPVELGETLRLAQRRTLSDAADDTLRQSLDMLARGLSTPPVDLAAERREHVSMYHLLGDPLVRLRRLPEEMAYGAGGDSIAK